MQALDAVQAGLLTQLFGSVWLPSLKLPSLRHDERKVCAVALAKLMSQPPIAQNAELLGASCVAMVSVLGLSSDRPEKEESEEEALPDGGAGREYEVSFNK